MKELPEGWEWVKLNDPEVCIINPKKTEISSLRLDTKVSFIPMSAVSEKGIILDKEERELNSVIKGYTYFKEDDVLFAKITPCMENGKIAIAKGLINGLGFGTTEFHILRPSKNVLPEWIFYYIRQNWFRKKAMRHFTGTAGQQRVPTSFLKKQKIPLPFKNSKPDLKKQQKIVTILEKAEQTNRLHAQGEELIDQFLKSVFLDMFGDPVKNEKGWKLVNVGEHVDVLTGYAFKSHEYVKDKSEIKLCGGLIILPDKIDWSKVNYWRRDKISGIEKYLLKEKDIVIAMDRPWISSGFKIGIINQIGLPALLVQRTARLRGVDFNQHFLYFIFKHKVFEIHCKLTETTVPHISPKDIKKYKIPFPPIELQNEFATVVEKVEGIQKNLESSKQESETLFNVLLQKAFTGKLIA